MLSLNDTENENFILKYIFIYSEGNAFSSWTLIPEGFLLLLLGPLLDPLPPLPPRPRPSPRPRPPLPRPPRPPPRDSSRPRSPPRLLSSVFELVYSR